MSDGIHVMPKGELWTVTRGNYLLDEFASKQQAMQLARQRAKTSRAPIILHGSDGSVQDVENFSESERRVRRQRSA